MRIDDDLHCVSMIQRAQCTSNFFRRAHVVARRQRVQQHANFVAIFVRFDFVVAIRVDDVRFDVVTSFRRFRRRFRVVHCRCRFVSCFVIRRHARA